MDLQVIRNATIRLTVGGLNLLVDPWLAARGQGPSYAGLQRSPLVDLPIPSEDVVRDVDAVLISHLHNDHFDEVAAKVLDRDIPILTHERNVDHIRGLGFTDVRAVVGTASLDAVEISLTGGRHGPDAVLEEMGPVNGFLVRAPGEPLLYWAGDTVFCEEVRDILRMRRPDVVVVHACAAFWGAHGPIVMDAAMVVETLERSGRAIVVATHMDAVDHATITREGLQAILHGAPDVEGRLLIPDDGEILHFNVERGGSARGPIG